jgi:hypothetical protein
LYTINLRKISEKGLIKFLPQSIKDLLLERSIFDILCDLWFFPRLSLVIKTIVWPFISKPKAEEAIKALDTLPEDIKEVFITKGVVNLFPKKLSKIILPNDMYNKYKIAKILDGNIDSYSMSKYIFAKIILR